MEVITSSARQTENLGRKIGIDLKKRSNQTRVITLSGPLGSGKTTFVKGLAKGLGIEKRVISPSFVLCRQYPLSAAIFYHLDFYRLGSKEEIESLGIGEILSQKNSIVAIEWPEKAKDLLPQETIRVYLNYLERQKRKIKIVWPKNDSSN